MSITYDEAMQTLRAMFPEWDADTIAAIFQNNNYHMERTIESILAINLGGATVQETPESPQPPREASIPTTMRSSAAAAPSSKNRGRPVTLPEDFLRPPGFKQDSWTVGDEQLAMMLQNEMFRRELQQELGIAYPWGAPVRPKPSSQRALGQSNAPQAQSQTGAPTIDTGSMFKAFQDMGDGIRRRVNELALRFRQRERLQEDDSTRPLNAQEDDDEAEVITFDQNVQRRHRLNDDVEEAPVNPVVNRSKKDR